MPLLAIVAIGFLPSVFSVELGSSSHQDPGKKINSALCRLLPVRHLLRRVREHAAGDECGPVRVPLQEAPQVQVLDVERGKSLFRQGKVSLNDPRPGIRLELERMQQR